MANIVVGGRNTYGEAIGILVLDTKFPRIPGDIGNATTWRFPVRYARVSGATAHRVVEEGDAALVPLFIEAARELEAAGVRAITTSCGFMAKFQKELASAVNVPVYASSLLLVPIVYRMLKPNQRVGILTGDSNCLGEAHFNGVGWSSKDIPIALVGLNNWEHFREVLLGDGDSIDPDRIGQEMVEAARRLVHEHPDVGAIVFECTNMAPYAHLVQEAVGLPVFDVQTLTDVVFEATHRVPYTGFM